MRIYITIKGGVATVEGYAPNYTNSKSISAVIIDQDVQEIDEQEALPLTQAEVADLLMIE